MQARICPYYMQVSQTLQPLIHAGKYAIEKCWSVKRLATNLLGYCMFYLLGLLAGVGRQTNNYRLRHHKQWPSDSLSAVANTDNIECPPVRQWKRKPQHRKESSSWCEKIPQVWQRPCTQESPILSHMYTPDAGPMQNGNTYTDNSNSRMP